MSPDAIGGRLGARGGAQSLAEHGRRFATRRPRRAAGQRAPWVEQGRTRPRWPPDSRRGARPPRPSRRRRHPGSRRSRPAHGSSAATGRTILEFIGHNGWSQARQVAVRDGVGVDLPAPVGHARDHGEGESPSEVVDDQVEHGGIAVGAQQRCRVTVLVKVAIVKAQHHGTGGQPTALRPAAARSAA